MPKIGLLVSAGTPCWVLGVIKRMSEIEQKLNALKKRKISLVIFQPEQSVLDRAGAGGFSFKKMGCDGVIAFHNPASDADFGMDLEAALKEGLPTLLLYEGKLVPPARIRKDVWPPMLLQIESFMTEPEANVGKFLARCTKFVTYLQSCRDIEGCAHRARSEFFVELSKAADLINIQS